MDTDGWMDTPEFQSIRSSPSDALKEELRTYGLKKELHTYKDLICKKLHTKTPETYIQSINIRSPEGNV